MAGFIQINAESRSIMQDIEEWIEKVEDQYGRKRQAESLVSAKHAINLATCANRIH